MCARRRTCTSAPRAHPQHRRGGKAAHGAAMRHRCPLGAEEPARAGAERRGRRERRSDQADVARLRQVALVPPVVARAAPDAGPDLGLDLVVGREAGASLLQLHDVLLATELGARYGARHLRVDAVLQDALQHDPTRRLDQHRLLVHDGVLGHRAAEDAPAAAGLERLLVQHLHLDGYQILDPQLLAGHGAPRGRVDLRKLCRRSVGRRLLRPETLLTLLGLVDHEQLSIPEAFFWPVVVRSTRDTALAALPGPLVPGIGGEEALVGLLELLDLLQLGLALLCLLLAVLPPLLLCVLLCLLLEVYLLL
mmetsp:Transcript_34320/g.107233  ORF Transcript_34320/g.107233 Transcript_34320/m.107233 type:complete len:308 (+) Transcript_34320:56-979(+)